MCNQNSPKKTATRSRFASFISQIFSPTKPATSSTPTPPPNPSQRESKSAPTNSSGSLTSCALHDLISRLRFARLNLDLAASDLSPWRFPARLRNRATIPWTRINEAYAEVWELIQELKLETPKENLH
jgi:hypothetical protein